MIMTFHKFDTPDVKRYSQAHIGHPGSRCSKLWHKHGNLMTKFKISKKRVALTYCHPHKYERNQGRLVTAHFMPINVIVRIKITKAVMLFLQNVSFRLEDVPYVSKVTPIMGLFNNMFSWTINPASNNIYYTTTG